VRVVHVTTAWPRSSDDPITPWLVELVRRQIDSGIQAEVLAPAYRGGPVNEHHEFPVHRFRYAPAPLETLTHDETVPDRLRRRPAYGLLVPSYLLAGMMAAVRIGLADPPDVVHVHWPMPHALIGAAMRRASRGRTAMVCSFYSVELNWVRHSLPLLEPFLNWTVGAADEATAISTSTAGDVQQVVGKAVQVIPYGAAVIDDGKGIARHAFIGEDIPTVLFVGRLVERKGVEVLIQAVAENQASRPVKLRIVGTGAWESKLRATVAEYELEDVVTFVGRVSVSELHREYESADVFVLPAVRDSKGDTEGLGVVLLEAMRFERPVVASNIGGIPDIISHEESGLLCPAGDAKSLAAAIARLIDNPEFARNLARQGRYQAAEKFGWDSVLDSTSMVYEQAKGRNAT
jgi:glycosyltransferase involved in cell wall biosynthesis